jgi:ABC-type uncharacterized transport system substrate-binding protein
VKEAFRHEAHGKRIVLFEVKGVVLQVHPHSFIEVLLAH